MTQQSEDDTNWCLSGGARGADAAWGAAASSQGHKVTHFSFAGHRRTVPKRQVAVLTEAELDAADAHCGRANETLRRTYPPRWMNVRNLLRRSWYVVAPAHSCYAISSFKDGEVDGGTAWAVQMFIDAHRPGAGRLYLFDQSICRWHEWDGDGWRPIYTAPRPSGVYAAVGTRDLNIVGRLAINVLFDFWPKQHTLWNN
jgi:hypothetical protein